jgi:hypothetical protein
MCFGQRFGHKVIGYSQTALEAVGNELRHRCRVIASCVVWVISAQMQLDRGFLSTRH